MSWLHPWVSRAGAVSSVEITRPVLPGGAFTTRFQLDNQPVRYLGRPPLMCNGDRAIIVGWLLEGEILACFLAVPELGWFFRSYSGVRTLVNSMLLLVFAAFVIAQVAVSLGVVLAAVATMSIFHAVAWIEGERLTRRVILAELNRSAPPGYR
ncbi:hypothetical protein [Sphingomonas sp. Leaf4]|uniref:hypothetical protein n=1 Tax=Sphingomonas sp. Leaf4 TaxID=2876553 RepID=UPI001E45037A|nr:hypothetical protein [Sphingomonas sp. Leaf4]